jgi:hypothetical protein
VPPRVALDTSLPVRRSSLRGAGDNRSGRGGSSRPALAAVLEAVSESTARMETQMELMVRERQRDHDRVEQIAQQMGQQMGNGRAGAAQ